MLRLQSLRRELLEQDAHAAGCQVFYRAHYYGWQIGEIDTHTRLCVPAEIAEIGAGGQTDYQELEEYRTHYFDLSLQDMG